MIARGAEGNPLDLRGRRKLRCQARRSLPVPAPSSASRWRGGTPRLLTQREGRNIMRMRKHAMWYMAGLPGCKRSGKDQLLLDPRAVRRRFRRAARDDRRERERGASPASTGRPHRVRKGEPCRMIRTERCISTFRFALRDARIAISRRVPSSATPRDLRLRRRHGHADSACGQGGRTRIDRDRLPRRGTPTHTEPSTSHRFSTRSA